MDQRLKQAIMLSSGIFELVSLASKGKLGQSLGTRGFAECSSELVYI